MVQFLLPDQISVLCLSQPVHFTEGDWHSSDADLDDPNVDPFSRESIFRQSISEKRKGAAARDTQNIDIVKLKNKQLSTEKGV